MHSNMLGAPMCVSGASTSSSDISNFVREGCNVINGTTVGAVIGGILCPAPGGPELGAAIGGWIGSKLSDDPTPATK